MSTISVPVPLVAGVQPSFSLMIQARLTLVIRAMFSRTLFANILSSVVDQEPEEVIK